jgi:hypothetical protein
MEGVEEDRVLVVIDVKGSVVGVRRWGLGKWVRMVCHRNDGFDTSLPVWRMGIGMRRKVVGVLGVVGKV